MTARWQVCPWVKCSLWEAQPQGFWETEAGYTTRAGLGEPAAGFVWLSIACVHVPGQCLPRRVGPRVFRPLLSMR